MPIASYYGVSIPLAFVFAIKMEYGEPGLWIGVGIGQVLMVIFYAIILYRADWLAVFQLNNERMIQDEARKLLYDIRSGLGSSW